MSETSALAWLARDVALACGRLIVDERPRTLDVATKSTATDVVTEMDQRSEALARELLTRSRPADGLFGEEGLDIAGTTDITWVVDPIDGTVNYLYEIPHFCVSVAAVRGNPHTPGAWWPVAGAVYAPMLDELFVAAHGEGSTLTSRGTTTVLRAAPATKLSQTLLGTGFAYAADMRAEQAAVLTRVLPQVRDIRRCGSAALDMCHVASRQLDAYYERGGHPWDIAAGWLVATEAGAYVGGLNADYPSADLTIVAASAIADQLRALICCMTGEFPEPE